MHFTIFSLVDRPFNIPYSYGSGSEGIRDINIWCKEENADGYCRFLSESFMLLFFTGYLTNLHRI